MSIEKERKAFEDWLKKENIFSGNDNNPNVIWAKKFMFKAWQASANREGYKLVPVNINENIESAMFSSAARGDMPRDIYKAMIGACDDH